MKTVTFVACLLTLITSSFGYADVTTTPSITIGNLSRTLTSALAAGGIETGGGDPCEDKFKIIRDDIATWIRNGGAGNDVKPALILPAAFSVQIYNNKMLEQISEVKDIRCVRPQLDQDGIRVDEVTINGVEKTCIFKSDSLGRRILCDFDRFMKIGDPERYRLVHHEYAGLAGVELPDGSDSHYEVSNQITAFLELQTIVFLAVKPAQRPMKCFDLTPELRAKVGMRCRTSDGEIFERVLREDFGEAWQDRGFDGNQNGIIWGDLVTAARHDWAADYCKANGGILPSKDDFESGEFVSFREVLPHIQDFVFPGGMGTAWYNYWTSTLYGADSRKALTFNGHLGTCTDTDRDSYVDFRCVIK